MTNLDDTLSESLQAHILENIADNISAIRCVVCDAAMKHEGKSLKDAIMAWTKTPERVG